MTKKGRFIAPSDLSVFYYSLKKYFVLFHSSYNFKPYSFKVKQQFISFLRELHLSLYFLAGKTWKEFGSVSSQQPSGVYILATVPT